MSASVVSQSRVLSIKIKLPLGLTAKDARRLLRESLQATPEQIIKTALQDCRK